MLMDLKFYIPDLVRAGELRTAAHQISLWPENYIDIREAAKITGIKSGTLSAACRRGNIIGVKRATWWFIRVENLMCYLDERARKLVWGSCEDKNT